MKIKMKRKWCWGVLCGMAVMMSVSVANSFAQELEAPLGAANNELDNALMNILGPEKDMEDEITAVLKEKKEIEKEKQEIKKDFIRVNGQSADLDGQSNGALKEKWDVVKEKEAIVTIKESLAQKKKELYEKVTALIEQKLIFIRDEGVNFSILTNEIFKSQNDVRHLILEKKLYTNELFNSNQEIKLLEQDITAKRVLKDLKKDTAYLLESISMQEARWRLLKNKSDQIQKKIELLDVQIAIIEDYTGVLTNRRKERMQKELLMPHPFVWSQFQRILGMMNLIILSILTYFLRVFVKRVKGGIRRYFWVQVVILWGWISLGVYYGGTALGYHNFVVYVGSRLLLSVGCLYAFGMVYGITRFLMKGAYSKIMHLDVKALKNENALFVVFKGVLWIGLAIIAGVTILNIWGCRYGHWVIFNEIIRYSLYKVGNVNVSLFLIMQIGFIIWGLNIFSHTMNKFLDKNVYPQSSLDEGARYTISVFIRYILILLGCLTGLNILGFELSTLNVLAGTVGIGIGFGLQEIAKNFISGLILLIERPVKVGDYIDLQGLPGRVEAIKARGTVVTTFDNISVVVPNSDFITKQVINWSYNDKVIRCGVSVGVMYGSDVDLVKKSLLEVANTHNKVLNKPAPAVYFIEFGESALLFKLYVWTNEMENRLQLQSDLHFMIDKAFRKYNIVIAFPQMDIHLKNSAIGISNV